MPFECAPKVVSTSFECVVCGVHGSRKRVEDDSYGQYCYQPVRMKAVVCRRCLLAQCSARSNDEWSMSTSMFECSEAIGGAVLLAPPQNFSRPKRVWGPSSCHYHNIISVFKRMLTLAKYRTIRSSLWPNVAKSVCFLRLADQQERSPSPVKYIREFRKEAIHRIRWTKLAVGLENSAWIQTDDTPRSRSKRR